MQCISHSYSYNTELSHGEYIESCLNLPAKRIRPPAEPIQKVASPVPAQFSLLTRTLATRRGRMTRPTSTTSRRRAVGVSCLTTTVRACSGCDGCRWLRGHFSPYSWTNEPVSELPGAVGVVDVWLDETFSRQPSAPAHHCLGSPGMSTVYADFWAAELHVSDASPKGPWSLCSISQTSVNYRRNASWRRG